MSDKDDIWLYLTYQNNLDNKHDMCWCATSFQDYIKKASVYTTKCQFIVIGKVLNYRDKHPELRPWRSGYLCFYSLNFAFEAKNIELLVALQQLLQIPHTVTLTPRVINYNGTKKEASEEMDRYFKQYINHVTIKGIHFVIIHKYDMVNIRSYLRKHNMEWVDHHYETWERIRPNGLVSDDDD